MIDGSQSLFTYPQGKTFADFRNESFVPLFEPVFADAAEQAKAEALCGDDKECLLDFAVTGNEDFAQSTLNESIKYQDEKTTLSK